MRHAKSAARRFLRPDWRLVGLALWAWLPVAASAVAQPILHEPVSAPTLSCAGGVCQRAGEQSTALPDAVQGEDGLIGAPLGGRNPQQHEPVFSSTNQTSPLVADVMRGAPPPGHDPPPVRRPRIAPDAETGIGPGGEHVYHEIFNPAIFPYKRMTALDAVDDGGALYISDRRYRDLQVTGNRLQSGRDPFYGSMVIDFIAGEPVPLPTPAAGFRLLSYKASPELPLAFYTDANENLYARAARGGRHRLVFLVDAEQRYFAGPLVPASLRRSIRLDGLPPPPAVPRPIKREADKVLRHIGLRPSPSSDYVELVNRLVAYFRAFQMADLPPEEDDEGRRTSLYLRIALSQRGVCRHRSYAFVITALAAGIPVRYVENELHVFVEVYVPPVGDQSAYWRRINLGGAPLEQRVYGGENREAYQEKGSDPFERPSAFTRAAAQVSGAPKRSSSSNGKSGSSGGSGSGEGGDGSGKGEGGDGSGKGGKDPKSGAADPSRSASQPGGTGGDGSGGAGRGGLGPGEAGEGGDGEAGGRSSRDSIEHPTDARSGSDSLISTHVTVSVGVARKIYRGAAVPVHGQVVADRGSVENLEVLLLLAVSQHPLILGRTLTRSDGTFDTEVEIPTGAPLGRFQLVARVRGDEKRRGSTSGNYDRLSRAATATQDFIENR